jgi:hypothetical protein
VSTAAQHLFRLQLSGLLGLFGLGLSGAPCQAPACAPGVAAGARLALRLALQLRLALRLALRWARRVGWGSGAL